MEMHALTKQEDALHTTITALGVTDPKAARAWLESDAGGAGLSEALRNRLAVGLLDGWAERSPKEAADYLLGIKDPATAGSAAKVVFSNWGAQSLGDALEWIGALEDSQKRNEFEYHLLMASSMHGDRTAALEHGLARLPENEGLTHAIYMLASGVIRDDLETAIPWAKETFAHVPQLQQEVYNTLLHQMR